MITSRWVTLVTLIIIHFPQFAFSTDWTIDASTLLDFRGKAVDRHSTPLRPTQKLLNNPTESLTSTGVLSLNLSKDAILVSSQLRGFVKETNANDKSDVIVDELYWEAAVGEQGFAFIGRRNLVRGPAYGISATDLFTDQIRLDRTLNENRRRREIEGTDAVGFDWFASDAVTLSAVVAPNSSFLNKDEKSRTQLAANILFPESGIDTTLLTFYDGKISLGGSMTTSLGDAVVLYGEGVVRRGRNVIIPTTKNIRFGTFASKADPDSWFTSTTFGVGYTSTGGTAFNIEYFRNGSGLSNSEWKEVIGLAKTNAANLSQYPKLSRNNLLLLNRTLRTATARRNYFFARLAQPDFLGLSKLNGEVTLFHALRDQSGVVNGRLEYDLSESTVFGLFGGLLYGSENSEFGLREDRKTGGTYITVYF